jgi:hypothetical protein
LLAILLICYSQAYKKTFPLLILHTIFYALLRAQPDHSRYPRRLIMPKKTPESFSYLANDPEFVPDPEIEEFMEEEIAHAPKDPDLLAQRLHNNTAASPQDAGGDIDAAWEDVNESGSETFAGDSPTPDQSMVEENAKAMGVSLEDNEELDFLEKLERRDRDRYELEEQSKASEDMI